MRRDEERGVRREERGERREGDGGGERDMGEERGIWGRRGRDEERGERREEKGIWGRREGGRTYVLSMCYYDL
jgi:hypothetical protein